MTRMRFIENKVNLDFNCKTSPDLAPENLTPWFKIYNEKLKLKNCIWSLGFTQWPHSSSPVLWFRYGLCLGAKYDNAEPIDG